MPEKKIDCEQAKIIMMGLVDEEINPADKKLVEEHIKSCTDCSREYESFSQLKKETKKMKMVKLPEEYWDAYWTNVYNRFERGVAWILLSIGLIISISYALYEAFGDIFNDPDIPLFLKIGIALSMIGGVVLIISVVREKWKIRKIDKYRSVQR